MLIAEEKGVKRLLHQIHLKNCGKIVLAFGVGVTLTFFLPVGFIAVTEALILIGGGVLVLVKSCN